FYIFLFFFSSRRRHTRLQGDWSSDVCSSDLSFKTDAGWMKAPMSDIQFDIGAFIQPASVFNDGAGGVSAQFGPIFTLFAPARLRSEERRVGKECRSAWGGVDE